MSASMTLDNFSIFWIDPPLSTLEGLLAKVTLHYDGFCTLQFHRYFTLVSLLHQYHAMSLQDLILDSLPLGLMLFFSQVGFS